jgi:hypothetical protein
MKIKKSAKMTPAHNLYAVVEPVLLRVLVVQRADDDTPETTEATLFELDPLCTVVLVFRDATISAVNRIVGRKCNVEAPFAETSQPDTITDHLGNGAKALGIVSRTWRYLSLRVCAYRVRLPAVPVSL